MIVMRPDRDVLFLQNRIRTFKNADNILRINGFAFCSDRRTDTLLRLQLKRFERIARDRLVEKCGGVELFVEEEVR